MLKGAESIAEDVYWWCGAEGIDRGYNVFAVDAPGDTSTRIYNKDMIIDGVGDDALLSQMDYILERPDVDSDNVFIYGISKPFLTLAGENELGGEGIRQALEFHDRVGSETKEKRIATVSEGAEAHCQLNNFPLARQIVFDWIEDIMKADKR